MICTRAIFALTLLASPATGQHLASRLTDINTTFTGPAATTDRIGDFLYWREMVTAGERVWFTADDGIHGVELWSTDGTEAGTRLITDLCPGRCSAHPRALTEFGARLFFIADDGVHGSEPWITDGTAAGTRLIADVWPGLGDGAGYGWAVATDTYVLFGGTTADEGTDPWVTDGTAEGTFRLKDFPPLLYSIPVLGVGRLGSYAFFVGDDGVSGFELWRTDGTAKGTVVLETNPGPAAGSDFTPNFGKQSATTADALYFQGIDALHGRELWRTDGTPQGTRRVRDIAPGPTDSWVSWLTARENLVYFSAQPDASNSRLWVSDGTESGTVPVFDPQAEPSPLNPQSLVSGAKGLFFYAQSAPFEPRELWFSDGTAAGSQPVLSDGIVGWPEPVATGSGVQFYRDDGFHGIEPWFSDGTVAGTIPLADLASGPEPSFGTWDYVRGWLRATLNGRAYFWAFSPGSDFELWSTDGTPAGTRKVKEVNGVASSIRVDRFYYYFDGPDYQPIGPAPTPSGLAFLATDGPLDPAHPAAGTTGLELWHVEHESGLVTPLGDLEPGPASSLLHGMVGLDTGILFSDTSSNLWRSRGAPPILEPLDGLRGEQIVRLPSAAIAGPGGTAISGDFTTRTPLPMGGDVLTTDGSRAFSASYTDDSLGVTDGTLAGTRSIVLPGRFPGSPASAQDNRIVFLADDPEIGRELWVWSEHENQAAPLLDVRPGPASGFPFGQPLNTEWEGLFRTFRTAGTTAFFAADDGQHGEELWASDGTAPGTRVIEDLLPGSRGSDPRRLTTIGSRLFFVADDGVHGRELWLSDGTAAGTRLVKDLAPGPGSAVPQALTAIGEFLVFSAWTPEAGRELWISDGTEIGTRQLVDVAPGPLSSSPVSFVAAGGWLYFTANDNVTGDELWRVPLSLLQPGTIFADGFESGGLSAWGASSP